MATLLAVFLPDARLGLGRVQQRGIRCAHEQANPVVCARFAQQAPYMGLTVLSSIPSRRAIS